MRPKPMKQLPAAFGLAFLLAAPAARAQATATATVTVGAEAGLTVQATSPLTESGGPFGAFTGGTNLTYYVRTSQSGGGGNIQVQVTSDFSPASGPAASAGSLKYTCAATAPGNSGTANPCSGSITASTAAQTLVTSFGSDARSSPAGNNASVQWTLKNDPTFKAGSYLATVTFTISAT
jgi:hypothetical protein